MSEHLEECFVCFGGGIKRVHRAVRKQHVREVRQSKRASSKVLNAQAAGDGRGAVGRALGTAFDPGRGTGPLCACTLERRSTSSRQRTGGCKKVTCGGQVLVLNMLIAGG